MDTEEYPKGWIGSGRKTAFYALHRTLPRKGEAASPIERLVAVLQRGDAEPALDTLVVGQRVNRQFHFPSAGV